MSGAAVVSLPEAGKQLDSVLARDEAAWRAFVAFYDGPLRAVVRHAAEATHSLTDDEIDDMLGDFWVALLANDMRMLRAFNPARGSALLTWLTFHVASVACAHVARRRAEPAFVGLHAARNVRAASARSPRLRNESPPADRPGVIDLRRELLGALDSAEAREALAAIVRETMRAEEGEAKRSREDGLLDANGAAVLLSMTPSAVRKAALRGSLPCRRLGRKLRFLRSELLALDR